MRITTANAHRTTIDTLQQRQQQLQQSQERLTSGKRVARASDDPAAAARAERALAAQSRAVADQRGLQASRSAMQQAETALGAAGEAMQQVRELLVAAGNASYGDAERANLGERIAGLRNQLLAIANRDDGAGGYLFGGRGAAAPPFVDGAGGVAFHGVGGETEVQASEPLPMTLDGHATWLGANSGNGVFVTAPASGTSGGAWVDAGSWVGGNQPAPTVPYEVQFSVSGGVTTYTVLKNGAPTAPPITNQPYVDGQAIEFDGMALTVKGVPAHGDRFDARPSAADLSLFSALDGIAAELRTPNRGAAQVAQTVASGLRDVDQLMGKLQLQRARAGEMLDRADTVELRLGDVSLHAQTQRSLAEDLDMVQGLSDFKAQQTGYEAALSSYAMVQRLSLLQYLK